MVVLNVANLDDMSMCNGSSCTDFFLFCHHIPTLLTACFSFVDGLYLCPLLVFIVRDFYWVYDWVIDGWEVKCLNEDMCMVYEY